MNKIAGKITLNTSNTGIPNLLVVIFDVDPGTKPEEIITRLSSEGVLASEASSTNTINTQNGLGFIGDRIGSVLTEADGSFLLEYEDSAFQTRNPKELRPDLFLMVFAPEKMGNSLLEALLFYPPEIRQNAGLIESYYIQISEDAIKASGLETLFESGNAATRTQLGTIQAVRAQSIASNRILVETEKEKQVLAKQIIANKAIPAFFGLQSKPVVRRATTTEIRDNNRKHINRINTDAQADSSVKGKTLFVYIPEHEINYLIEGNSESQSEIIGNYIAKFDEIAVEGAVFKKEFCTPLSDEEKELLVEKLSSPSTDTVNDGVINVPGATGETSEGMADYVKKLIDPLQSPEKLLEGISQNPFATSANQRPDGSTINENVRELEFKGGPADVPAFYDFHSLQIAFPHIWQELIDNDILQLSEALLEQLEEDGVDTSDITDEDDLQEKLDEKVRLAEKVAKINTRYQKTSSRSSLDRSKDGYREEHLDNSPQKTPPSKTPLTESGWLLDDLKNALNEKPRFTIFKEGHINYGILISYRQKWVPLNYQVGDLVKSIPLSPKEVRKVNIKKVVKKDNVTKSMENNLRSSQEEENTTGRTESEIVQKAQNGNSFGASASFSRWGITASADYKSDASKSSDSVKKEFREAIKKAAQEFKDEHKLEIETKESFDNEYSESTDITNPNDELTVTYLFYELQRRFQVSEKLHKVTPIVLVPMPMPTPSRKDMNTLILKHGWIINRVLLDDRFRAALEYVMEGLIGEEAAIEELKNNIKALRENLKNLSNLLTDIRAEVVVFKEEYNTEQEQLDDSNKNKTIEKNKFQVEIAKSMLQEAKEKEQVVRDRIAAENTSLVNATRELNRTRSTYESKLFEINLLRLHIKENIFYYMQAIWDYTHKDNTFMTLYDDKIPVIEARQKHYKVVNLQPQSIPPSMLPLPNMQLIEVEVKYEMEIPPNSDMQTLIEIADLDNPLGYKGNYMIFPMKRPNAVTEYMMTPYLDEELGLRDPDGWGQWTPDEFVEFFYHLKQTKPREEFEQMEAALVAQYGRILDASRRLVEDIVVPTDSLYIEALPGKHPLLEDFKLKHRLMDVQKVQAEVRKMELENLRYAARILDSQLDDPDTEKKVIVGEGINTHLNE